MKNIFGFNTFKEIKSLKKVRADAIEDHKKLRKRLFDAIDLLKESEPDTRVKLVAYMNYLSGMCDYLLHKYDIKIKEQEDLKLDFSSLEKFKPYEGYE